MGCKKAVKTCNGEELSGLGRDQLKGRTDLHVGYPLSVVSTCSFFLGDFWRHLFSKSEYRYQESVFLETFP